MDSQDSDHQANSGRVFIGVVIILIGVTILGQRVGFEGIHLSGHYWPLILVALGAMKVLDPGQRGGHRRSRRSGAWLMYLGCWFLVNEFHVYDFDYGTSWPLLVIGVGVMMVWRAFENPGRRCDRVRES